MTREPEGRGSAPVCTILGGPNGSGKSSLYRALAPPGAFVNTDLIARAITPTIRMLRRFGLAGPSWAASKIWPIDGAISSGRRPSVPIRHAR